MQLRLIDLATLIIGPIEREEYRFIKDLRFCLEPLKLTFNPSECTQTEPYFDAYRRTHL